MPRKASYLLVVVLLLFQVSCALESKNPICSLEEAYVDRDAIGTWRMDSEGGETMFVHIGSSFGGPENLMTVAIVNIEDDGRLKLSMVPFFVSSLEEATYINMPQPDIQWRAGEPWDLTAINHYGIFRYEIEEDELRLFPVDLVSAATAVHDGQLEGNVSTTVTSEGEKVKSVRLSDTSENIAAFLKDDGILFSAEPFMVLQRVAGLAAIDPDEEPALEEPADE